MVQIVVRFERDQLVSSDASQSAIFEDAARNAAHGEFMITSMNCLFQCGDDRFCDANTIDIRQSSRQDFHCGIVDA